MITKFIIIIHMNFTGPDLALNNLQSGYSKEPNLLKNYHNGIVNDIQYESVESRLKMFERVSSTNKSSSYSSALKGIGQDSVCSQAFFSKENVQILQNNLRASIHEKTGYTIPPQNIDSLMIIMRSMFLQYGNFAQTNSEITQEIERLNQYVLNYIVPEVQSSLKAYLHYLKEQSSLPVPIGQPVQVDRNFNQLEGNIFM